MFARSLRFTTQLLADMLYSLRGLRKTPGYALTTVMTLALGLGAVTSMLAVVDSVLLRPIDLPRAGELVMLYLRHHNGSTNALSYKEVDNLARATRLFSDVSGYNTMTRPVTTADGTRMALQTTVTPNLFNTLGAQPRYGRLFSDADQDQYIAVVSAAFWHEQLHSNPAAIGSTLKISGQLRTVIGVLADGLKFPQGLEAPLSSPHSTLTPRARTSC